MLDAEPRGHNETRMAADTRTRILVLLRESARALAAVEIAASLDTGLVEVVDTLHQDGGLLDTGEAMRFKPLNGPALYSLPI